MNNSRSIGALISAECHRYFVLSVLLFTGNVTDNSGALFVAVRAILTKLVEGTSASFDMPTRQDSSTSTSARHAGSNHHGHAHGASGGDGDGTGGDGHHHGGGGGGGGGNRHGSDEDDDPFHPNG